MGALLVITESVLKSLVLEIIATLRGQEAQLDVNGVLLSKMSVHLLANDAVVSRK